jgi:hypothetical protein
MHKNTLRGSGGISVFTKKTSCVKVKTLKVHDDFILWLHVQVQKTNFALGVVYFAPGGSTCNIQREDYFDSLLDDIRELKYQFPLMIIGDFTSRTNVMSDICYDVEGSDIPASLGGYIEDSDSFPETLSTPLTQTPSLSDGPSHYYL